MPVQQRAKITTTIETIQGAIHTLEGIRDELKELALFDLARGLTGRAGKRTGEADHLTRAITRLEAAWMAAETATQDE